MIEELEQFKKLREIANDIFIEYVTKNGAFPLALKYASRIEQHKKSVKEILANNNIKLHNNEIDMLIMILEDRKSNNLMNKCNFRNESENHLTKKLLYKVFDKTLYSRDACILACLHERDAFESDKEYSCLLQCITYYLILETNIKTTMDISFNLEEILSIEDVSDEIRVELFVKGLNNLMGKFRIKLSADYTKQCKNSINKSGTLPGGNTLIYKHDKTVNMDKLISNAGGDLDGDIIGIYPIKK